MSTNPNNCTTCKHRPHGGPDGWCYMFRDEPTETCMQHSGRNEQRISIEEAARMLGRLNRRRASGPN